MKFRYECIRIGYKKSVLWGRWPLTFTVESHDEQKGYLNFLSAVSLPYSGAEFVQNCNTDGHLGSKGIVL